VAYHSTPLITILILILILKWKEVAHHPFVMPKVSNVSYNGPNPNPNSNSNPNPKASNVSYNGPRESKIRGGDGGISNQDSLPSHLLHGSVFNRIARSRAERGGYNPMVSAWMVDEETGSRTLYDHIQPELPNRTVQAEKLKRRDRGAKTANDKMKAHATNLYMP